jgi:hypothetical protein
MVILDTRALNLEYLVKILNWSRSRYIFTDSDSDSTTPTPTPQPCLLELTNKTIQIKQ